MQVCKFSVATLLFVISCTPVSNEDEVVIKSRAFEIVIPSKFDIVDSGVIYDKKYLISKVYDTCFFELGLSVNTLAESCPEYVYITKNAFDKVVPSLPEGPYYTSDPNYDLDRLRKQNVEFCYIRKSPTKITKPTNAGEGIIGIYIDSIGIGNQSDAIGIIKFSMYTKANGLSDAEINVLVELYKSIDIRDIDN
jgi:hypothetical protein